MICFLTGIKEFGFILGAVEDGVDGVCCVGDGGRGDEDTEGLCGVGLFLRRCLPSPFLAARVMGWMRLLW